MCYILKVKRQGICLVTFSPVHPSEGPSSFWDFPHSSEYRNQWWTYAILKPTLPDCNEPPGRISLTVRNGWVRPQFYRINWGDIGSWFFFKEDPKHPHHQKKCFPNILPCKFSLLPHFFDEARLFVWPAPPQKKTKRSLCVNLPRRAEVT